MNAKEFQQQRKNTLTQEYADLKKSNSQTVCFEILGKKHDLSPETVRHIIFNSNYNTKKPTKAA